MWQAGPWELCIWERWDIQFKYYGKDTLRVKTVASQLKIDERGSPAGDLFCLSSDIFSPAGIIQKCEILDQSKTCYNLIVAQTKETSVKSPLHCIQPVEFILALEQLKWKLPTEWRYFLARSIFFVSYACKSVMDWKSSSQHYFMAHGQMCSLHAPADKWNTSEFSTSPVTMTAMWTIPHDLIRKGISLKNF